jgi:hypothetical protein
VRTNEEHQSALSQYREIADDNKRVMQNETSTQTNIGRDENYRYKMLQANKTETPENLQLTLFIF